MSYPGGPGYPYQQPGANPPYPPQQGYPGAAPPYPPQGGVYPPSLGYPNQSPIYMPQPGGYSPYPPQGAYPGGPPSQGNYPPPQGNYPGGPGGYPGGPQGHVPYPSSHGGMPPTGGVPVYPSAVGEHFQGYGGGGYGGGSHEHGPTTGAAYASSVAPSYGASQPAKKKSPTVVPANPFNAQADAEILRKAMKGFGTDEKAIINVLARRPNDQRLEIAVMFKTLYGKDLIKDLKSELSGNFENLVVAMMTPLPQYYAKEINDALGGLGTDEDVLVEVLCTLSNAEIRTIRTAYQELYYRDLEDDLRGDTSGTFKRLMVSLCNANRDESGATNQAQASADAQQLLTAGVLQLGTDESTFNMILCQRNHNQLKLTFDEYQKISGHDIEDAIKGEFSGDSEEGLLAIVRSVRNQPLFFARRLHKSVACMGTNDRDLIRLMVTRSEIDMGEIMQQYSAKYGTSLGDDIKGDTSGHYKKCLLALIGEY